MPSYVPEWWGEVVGRTAKKYHRSHGGYCENMCSNHGTCTRNQNCVCYTALDSHPMWVGPDCSQRACPRDRAWVGDVVGANDLHPVAECSNKGLCDRRFGLCSCFAGYDGVACQRMRCPNDCSGHGVCVDEKHLAMRANRVYDKAWDAEKTMGCLCDKGFRGPDCQLAECPSGPDPLGGFGNESGRDCSGRGVCDYTKVRQVAVAFFSFFTCPDMLSPFISPRGKT